MRHVISVVLTGLIVLGPLSLAAQYGTIDPTFNPTDIGFGSGDGANNTVYSTALKPDGKILIGGSFTSYNGTVRNRITRLNADGDLDASFAPGTGASSTVYSTALQPDGKILIAGDFTSYNGTSRIRIARLNADGSLDASFDHGAGANNSVYTIALQSDGKILIGGIFTSYDGMVRNYIARLNADGSLDASFNPGTGANSSVFCTALQPDGKILVGGPFTVYNGTGRNRIARLNDDGSLDASFNTGTGANSSVQFIALQPDGKIIFGGEFTSFGGIGRNRIARLNDDGSLDASFNPGTGANNTIKSVALHTDGKILIGGDFTSYNGTGPNRIARLNTDGTQDVSFNFASGPSSTVQSFALRSDGKILIGGSFSSYIGTARNRIARLNSNGSLDASFNPATGANESVRSTALQADGKILIGGEFTRYNGTVRNRIARLNTDGSLDATFNPGTGADNSLNFTALLPDGKILIGGGFTSFNGTGRHRIARLNINGSLDVSFDPGTGANNPIESAAQQPDGKILIGGWFTSYNGTGRNYIARLNADGSLEASFNPGTGASSAVRSTILQPDGKILIGGDFISYNGTVRSRIARLNADGSLDASFNPGTGTSGTVFSIALQPDGKILIGGSFISYNGTGRNRIARLNDDGSLDASFNPGTGADNSVNSIVRQPDGKILIGGTFTSYNGTGRNCIARLNADGSLDASFNPCTGANSWLLFTGLQTDGRIILGGGFTTYNGTGRNRLARVNSATPDTDGDQVADDVDNCPAVVNPMQENVDGDGLGDACDACSPVLRPKLMLEGPYDTSTGLMSDALRSAGLVPLTEPYTAAGYMHVAGNGGATIASAVLNTTGANAIVDWVLVELRSASNSSVRVATRAALLQRDGDVVGVDGTSGVGFNVACGNYYVAVRHRNHLGVMSLNSMALSTTATTVDFGSAAAATFGTNARKSITGIVPCQALWAGDATFNGQVRYTGSGNDRDPILVKVGSTTPNNTVSGYRGEDVNMNGVVRYTGSANDRDPILVNVGSTTPNNVRPQQLP